MASVSDPNPVSDALASATTSEVSAVLSRMLLLDCGLDEGDISDAARQVSAMFADAQSGLCGKVFKEVCALAECRSPVRGRLPRLQLYLLCALCCCRATLCTTAGRAKSIRRACNVPTVFMMLIMSGTMCCFT